jgi:predicted nucleic acid-binding protein
MLILDSTAIVFAVKLDYLENIKRIWKDICLPESVKIEVVDKGLKAGYEDASLIDRLIKRGVIKVIKIEDKVTLLLNAFNIHIAEAHSILLALKYNGILITDDKHARSAAKALGVRVFGSISLIVKLAEEKCMEKSKAIEILKRFPEVSGRIEFKILFDAIERIQK